VSAERIARIHERVNAAGGRMDLFFYDEGHALLRDDPGTHHAESPVRSRSCASTWDRRSVRTGRFGEELYAQRSPHGGDGGGGGGSGLAGWNVIQTPSGQCVKRASPS
jgi:hypothetical protein